MTHTLHRQGSVESLKSDYVVLNFCSAKRDFISTQKVRLRKKFPRSYRLLKRIYRTGIGFVSAVKDKVIGKQQGKITPTMVCNSREELCTYLKWRKGVASSMSVVVSGLFDEVFGCLKEVGLRPHTVQLSLGYFGKTELLPRQEILEITSMCGHHMIAANLVIRLAEDIKKGRMTPEGAAGIMSNLCLCGAFNKKRAIEMMKSLA